jgi:nicotinamidase-related amidase
MRRISRDDTIIAIIDVQEKLLPVIHDHESTSQNIERLIRGAAILGVPVVVTEQYVKGLGATVPRLRTALEETGGYSPIEKMCFSSAGCEGFMEAIEKSGRREILVAGIETHVCVYQTVLDLLDRAMSVYVVADAVSSRSVSNRAFALQRMTTEGAKLTTTEMALFELTVRSGTDEFRAISKLVK